LLDPIESRNPVSQKKHLQAAKQKLNEVYTELEVERLKVQLEEAELAIHSNSTAKAWKIVNTVTNRKTSPTGKLKGCSPKERIDQWLTHFKSLLGSSDQISDTNSEIEPILRDVVIQDTAFSLEEVAEARKQVREGKAPGEDGIMPEVLKRIGIDDIILTFSKKVLLENVTPEQFFKHTPYPKIWRLKCNWQLPWNSADLPFFKSHKSHDSQPYPSYNRP